MAATSASSSSSSFRIYLPSNASPHVHPDNKPSSYTTELLKPIHLDEAPWTVGVESICYKSNYGDREEKGTITMTHPALVRIPQNDVYPTKYKVLLNNRWNYRPRQWPLIPNTTRQLKSEHIFGDELVQALNALNKAVLAENPIIATPPAFTFTREGRMIKFETPYPGLAIRFSGGVAKLLGYTDTFHITRSIAARTTYYYRDREMPHKRDFQFQFFDPAVVNCEKRIILKEAGVLAPDAKSFVQQWNKAMKKSFNSKAWLRDDNRIIIGTYSKFKTFVLNQPLRHCIRHYEVMIGTGEFWGRNVYPSADELISHQQSEWIVEVYNDELKEIQARQEVKHTLSLQPRQFPTAAMCIEYMSKAIALWLSKLQFGTDLALMESIKTFVLKVKNNLHVKLHVPPFMTIHFSPNLLALLGFIESHGYGPFFGGVSFTGSNRASSLDERERELFITSDIIEETSYGSEKVSFLQHFIHQRNDKKFLSLTKTTTNGDIVQRTFDPIIHLPVAHKYITSINIELISVWRECLHITDTKTLVVLHFQKAQL